MFERPHLVTSGHATNRGLTPELLRYRKVMSPEEAQRKNRSPDVPLYQEARSADENIAVQCTPQGRALYVAFRDKDTLEQ